MFRTLKQYLDRRRLAKLAARLKLSHDQPDYVKAGMGPRGVPMSITTPSIGGFRSQRELEAARMRRVREHLDDERRRNTAERATLARRREADDAPGIGAGLTMADTLAFLNSTEVEHHDHSDDAFSGGGGSFGGGGSSGSWDADSSGSASSSDSSGSCDSGSSDSSCGGGD